MLFQSAWHPQLSQGYFIPTSATELEFSSYLHRQCTATTLNLLQPHKASVKASGEQVGRTDLTMSVKKRLRVCLLKPWRSSITNVLYKPHGIPSAVFITLVTRANTIETAYSFCSQPGLMRPAIPSDAALHGSNSEVLCI